MDMDVHMDMDMDIHMASYIYNLYGIHEIHFMSYVMSYVSTDKQNKHTLFITYQNYTQA